MTWATKGPELRAERAPASVSERGAHGAVPERPAQPAAVGRDRRQRRRTRARPGSRGSSPSVARGSRPTTTPPRPCVPSTCWRTSSGWRASGCGRSATTAGLPGYPELVRDTFELPVVASVDLGDPITAKRGVDVRMRLYDGPDPVEAVRLSNDGETWGDWLPIHASDHSLPWELAPGLDGSTGGPGPVARRGWCGVGPGQRLDGARSAATGVHGDRSARAGPGGLGGHVHRFGPDRRRSSGSPVADRHGRVGRVATARIRSRRPRLWRPRVHEFRSECVRSTAWATWRHARRQATQPQAGARIRRTTTAAGG